ncbi:prolyl oligopeptidase family serine peptidase [Clostridium sp. HBUAS56010]|uniref:prolyl oligopeptidase family serine peptidase n=1 Tax=Clostridium sp. HBUAS56010 TaxID=2571127 RepID=UPI001178AF47|nr:prolyl oligopeptidase family serine peptidase [Clostridium sp. HBUAS56010]
MTDEQYIGQGVITCIQKSPDEALAAVVRRQPNLEENKNEYQLSVYDSNTWKPVLDADPVQQASVWWLSDNCLLIWEKDHDYRVLDVRTGEKSGFSCPARVEQVLFLDSDHLLFKLQEEILQDPDFFTTESLPFLADGKGYIRQFGTLWVLNKESQTWKRIVSAQYQVQLVTVLKGRIYITGYERQESRVDFQHSAVYEIPWDGEEVPRLLLKDFIYRIDTIQPWGDYLLLAASDMKRFGPNQNPDFYKLSESGSLTLFAANEESASHTVVRDWKSTARRYGLGKDGLYYLSTFRGDGIIKKLDWEGTITTALHEEGVTDDFQCFFDGRLLVSGSYLLGFDELYVYEAGIKKQVSDFHPDINDKLKPVRPVPGEFSPEGQPVDYFVLPPRHLPEGVRCCPAIVSIHGGHKMAYGRDALMIDFQLWSDEGYFVIFCNPRGSDGLDNQFADVIGNNGKTDMEDILKSLDLALETWKQIDPQRIGITGGSYGGYLTNWMITQTNRFACAVSVRSISNRISKQMASDTGFRYPLVRLHNRVWEDFQEFWDASPVQYISQCTTPTLLVHAEGDLRCPIEEAIQMYTALKLSGVPAKLVIFKGESHGLTATGKPQARLKHSREIRKWFASYLKPSSGIEERGKII